MKYFKKAQFILLFMMLIFLAGCNQFMNSTTTDTGATNQTTETSTTKETLVVEDSFVEALLSQFNETYTIDMTENDFSDVVEYEEYTYALMISEAYATAVLREGLTSESAIQIIVDLKTLSDQLMTVEGLNEAKSLFDELFIGTELDTESFANIVVELADVVIDISQENQTDPDVIATLIQFDELVNDEKEAFVAALKSVSDFSMDVYHQIDTTLITHLNDLLTGEILTVEEIFILKNEIHAILDETLPSIEDYENAYTVYALLSTLLYNDTETTIDEDFITTLASMTHHSNQLLIDFIGEVDEQVYNDVMLLVTESYTPGYCEDLGDYNYQCYEPQYDVNKMVDFILYIDQFFTNFKSNQQDTIDNLNNLYTDEFKNNTYLILEDFILIALEETYRVGPELDAMITVVEDVFDNIHIFEDAHEVFEKLGVNAYNQFIETNGQMIIDFYNVVMSIQEGTDPYTLVTDFENIFSQYLDYHHVTIETLTIDDLTSIIQLYLYSAKFTIIQTDISVDIDHLIDTLPAILADIIYPFIELETALLNNIEQNAVISAIFNHGETMTLDESALAQLIITLNEILTPEMQAKLTTSIERLFDEVYSHETLMPLHEMSTDAIAALKTATLENMNALFIQLELVASYDFENLTAEQEFEIAVLIYMLSFGKNPINPSELINNSTDINLDSIITDELDIGEIDYYKFTITETKDISIYTSSSMDMYGYLYDSSLNLINENDDSGDGLNFNIQATLEPGTYYVVVKGYTKDEVGQYSVHLEEDVSLTDEVKFVDYNLEAAIRYELDIPSAPITIEDCLAVRFLNLSYYNITNIQGLEYFTNLESLALFYNQIEDLSPISQLTNLKRLGLFDNQITDLSPLSNLIYLERLSLQYNNISDLSPLNNLENLTYLNLSDNNITDLSGLTKLPSLNHLNLNNNDITDLSVLKTLYDNGSFTSDSDRYYDIQLHGNLNLDLSEGTTNASIYDYLTTNGVRIYINQDDYSNNFEDADTISSSSIINGILEHNEDIDCFKFTITNTSSISIYTTGLIDTRGSIYDENYNEISFNDDGGSESNFLINITLEPGTYYIKVEGYDVGAYQLLIEDGTYTETEDDYSDTIDSAYEIYLGTTTFGELEVDGDIDFFQFIITESVEVIIYTTGTTDTFGILYNEECYEINYNDDVNLEDFNFSISVILEPGTYYLRVNGFDTSTGEYQLHIETSN